MIVRFNATEEFLEEMEKDRTEIERGVVRLTTLMRADSKTPGITHYLVLATYRRGDEIVKLEHYCGWLWQSSVEAERAEVEKKRDKVYEALEAKAKELALELRGGVFE